MRLPGARSIATRVVVTGAVAAFVLWVASDQYRQDGIADDRVVIAVAAVAALYGLGTAGRLLLFLRPRGLPRFRLRSLLIAVAVIAAPVWVYTESRRRQGRCLDLFIYHASEEDRLVGRRKATGDLSESERAALHRHRKAMDFFAMEGSRFWPPLNPPPD